MEGINNTFLPKIVKGLGLGALALIGLGGGIAYANYRAQKSEIDSVNKVFFGCLEEVNKRIGKEKVMNSEIFLLLQEAMIARLKEPYLRVTQKSRHERRALLPVSDLGPEFAEFASRFKRKATKSSPNEVSEDSDILQYLKVHTKYEGMIVDLMKEIAEEMLEHLPNIPKNLKADHLVQIILMPRLLPKQEKANLDLEHSRGQSIFSRKLTEIRFQNIERFYPDQVSDKARLDSPSYFCRVLNLRNQFFQKFKFNGLSDKMAPSELMRLKKLFVNDLVATITGVEEEHIEWLLNHIQIKQDKSSRGRLSKAVEIDEFGQETVIENYKSGQRVVSQGLEMSDSEKSDQDESNSAETDEIFSTSKSDIIWITLEEAGELKNHLDNYTMLLAAEMLLIKRPEFERDVIRRREELRSEKPELSDSPDNNTNDE